MAPSLTAVLVADTAPDAVLTALRALVAGIDAAEAAGGTVAVTIVDDSGDPRVGQALAAVEGADLIRNDPPRGRGASWARAAAEATTDLVWLGATDAEPEPGALAALVARLDSEPGAAAAVPGPDPGPSAVVRRDALTGARVPDDATSVATVLAALDGGVVAAPGAGCVRRRVREAVAGPAFGAARVEVVRPGGFTVGTASYAGPGTLVKTWAPTERIELGSYCSLADDIRLLAPGDDDVRAADGTPLELTRRGVHRPHAASTFPIGVLVPEAPYDEAPDDAVGQELVIGDDVWIGVGALVLGGVSIGTGAVVGAGAVVTSDVPPYSVVAGNPARVLRERVDAATAARLQRIGWWDWSPELVLAAWRWFTRPAAAFADHFDPAGAAQ